MGSSNIPEWLAAIHEIADPAERMRALASSGRLGAASLPPDEWADRMRELRSEREREAHELGRRTCDGTEEPRDVFMAQIALPPPHLSITRAELAAEEMRNQRAQQRRARQKGANATDRCARLPSWVRRIALRCRTADSYAASELGRLPPYLQPAIAKAAARARTPEAARAVIGLAVGLTWLALRNPRRCGKVSTLAGLPRKHLASLCYRGTTGPETYSVSSVWHRQHDDAPAAAAPPNALRGPRGGVYGDPDSGDVGFIGLLEIEGALRVWVPPTSVPPWMRSARGYAYACIRVPSAIQESSDATRLARLLARVGASPPPLPS